MNLILCGGGSGEQNTLANAKLNEIIDHQKPILYIPLAMDDVSHPYDECYNWITSELASVDVPHIDMVKTFIELAQKDLSLYSALFIGGGNVYRLLSGLKESGAFNNIRNFIDNNGVVIGGSAGAVIFGYDVNVISKMDANEVNLTDTKGFDVLNGISIFPHYTNKKRKLTEEENEIRFKTFTEDMLDFSKRVGDIIAIPEEDAIVVSDNDIQVIGTRPYYTVKDGNIKKSEIENPNLKR